MCEDGLPFQCHPPRTPLWQWPILILATVAVFGGIISMGLIMVSDLITNYQTTQQTRLVLFAIGSVLSLVLVFIFVRWEQERWHWVLERDTLIGGRKKSKVIPLSSIATIVPGLPDKVHALVAANQFVHPELWANVMTERKLALLLKFSDGSFMPFHVHRCAGGSQLMTELVKRLADRLDHDYEYTPQEVKALRAADWNRTVNKRSV